MKNTKLRLFVFTLILVMMYAFDLASARESLAKRLSSPDAVVLNPGMSSSCQNDFVIENLDARDVELEIILGKEVWMKDRIHAKGAKAYGLQGSLVHAQEEGKQVFADDVATIMNSDKISSIILHCME